MPPKIPPQKPKPVQTSNLGMVASAEPNAKRAYAEAVLRLGPLLLREKVLGVENSARNLGLLNDLHRSREIMATPAADSAFSVSGGGEVGPFYPGNRTVRGVVGRLVGATGGTVTEQDIEELARRGFYNPLTGRSGFPASTSRGEERARILEAAAAQHAHARKMSLGGASDARRYAKDFSDAYDFLIQTSREQNPTWPDRDGYFGGIVADLLRRPLFSGHPLGR